MGLLDIQVYQQMEKDCIDRASIKMARNGKMRRYREFLKAVREHMDYGVEPNALIMETAREIATRLEEKGDGTRRFNSLAPVWRFNKWAYIDTLGWFDIKVPIETHVFTRIEKGVGTVLNENKVEKVQVKDVGLLTFSGDREVDAIIHRMKGLKTFDEDRVRRGIDRLYVARIDRIRVNLAYISIYVKDNKIHGVIVFDKKAMSDRNLSLVKMYSICAKALRETMGEMRIRTEKNIQEFDDKCEVIRRRKVNKFIRDRESQKEIQEAKNMQKRVELEAKRERKRVKTLKMNGGVEDFGFDEDEDEKTVFVFDNPESVFDGEEEGDGGWADMFDNEE